MSYKDLGPADRREYMNEHQASYQQTEKGRATRSRYNKSEKGRTARRRYLSEDRASGRTSWQAMKARCYNPNNNRFKYYGGQGVRVCERWRTSFANFIADMGPRPSLRHTIDRYPETDGDYEPGNCRWATHKEQANNQRRGNQYVRFVE